jgi:hypothetical protein
MIAQRGVLDLNASTVNSKPVGMIQGRRYVNNGRQPMKRFDIESYDYILHESETGEFVKYEEAAAEIEDLEKEIAELKDLNELYYREGQRLERIVVGTKWWRLFWKWWR